VPLHVATADMGDLARQLKHSDRGRASGEGRAPRSQLQDSYPRHLKASNAWKGLFKTDIEWAYMNINKYFSTFKI